MRRLHVSEALGLGFDHRAEVVATVGALLLQVGADGGEVFGVERFCKQVAVGNRKKGQVHLSGSNLDRRRRRTCIERWTNARSVDRCPMAFAAGCAVVDR